jgi:hypothetical protein
MTVLPHPVKDPTENFGLRIGARIPPAQSVNTTTKMKERLCPHLPFYILLTHHSSVEPADGPTFRHNQSLFEPLSP